MLTPAKNIKRKYEQEKQRSKTYNNLFLTVVS